MENKEINKHCENTVHILNGTALSDGITLTYYLSSSSVSKEDDLVKMIVTKLQKKQIKEKRPMLKARMKMIVTFCGLLFLQMAKDLK